MVSDLLVLEVAGLRLRLDAGNIGLELEVDECHSKFLQPLDLPINLPKARIEGNVSPILDELTLTVEDRSIGETDLVETLLIQSHNWELWVDQQQRFHFLALTEIPPIFVIIDHRFQQGVVQFGYSAVKDAGFYPLKSLGIKIFINWLATFGDFVMHASGMILDGKGYCFAGEAGIGKSTLIKQLTANPSTVILGEDQVVVRYREGQFWVYGTPWHLDPDMCSPAGAPLEKLFFLERRGVRQVSSITPMEGVTRLLQTAFLPYYQAGLMPKILDRLSLLSTQVPFFTLSYNLGDDVWPLIL